jgi:lysophospholipase L1-like esterase
MEIRSSATILFQGDSITDADRNRRKTLDLGTGYVMMVAERFSAKYPERKVTFLNRGLSGNRVRDLRNRWRKDCLDLKPNVVSIMIGVNDTLGGYFWNSLTSVEEFENDYRMILQQTSDLLGVKIVLLEPFMLSAAKNQFGLGEDLDNRVKITRKLSKEFGTYLVPLNKIFEDAERIRDPSFWSADGIHPTLAGHALIAQNWLKTIAP